ncbi:hypothetical protein IVB08_36965 [Bradyrhizobium sp. 173]|uniref:hypothetical protein n=1 Tax=Bradyrhizobium sp. 173 TaxID=2782644 RepID=UPI001FFBE668|nr:hypothetical protein [Bradyrhizobium sp. 173]MCK1569441.1 hypothetical protein [Bradyrhizobium sp. 173]
MSEPVIAQLGERWRVVCDAAQWVLEHLHSDSAWHARAHCASRVALGRVIELHVTGPVSMSELALVVDLPDRPSTVEPPVAPTSTSGAVKPPSRPWRSLLRHHGIPGFSRSSRRPTRMTTPFPSWRGSATAG